MNNFTNRQKEIIEASVNIIAEYGIQRLTIKNIAKSLGISDPAIYRHFDSKIDILLAILSHFKTNSQFFSAEIIASKTSPIEQIEFIFTNLFKQFTVNPALTAVIFSEEIFQNDEQLSEQVNSIINLNQKMIVEIIEKGQRNNKIRNDIPAHQLSVITMGALRLIIKKWRLSCFSFNLETEGADLWNSIKKLITI